MRRFAVGTRGTLLLARSGTRETPDAAPPRLLKVFHPGTTSSSIDVELAALCSVGIPHIVRLLDVATVVPGQPPCLVFEKLAGPTLASHLGDGPSLTPGQAVTVLAPLCSAIQALHDAGVTHGGIHARRVVFDQNGAPHLTGFGRGAVKEHGLSTTSSGSTVSHRGADEAQRTVREQVWRAAVLQDQRDVLALVTEVFAAARPMPHTIAPRLSAMIDKIGRGPSREFLVRLESLLFDCAHPESVGSVPHGRASDKHATAAVTAARTEVQRSAQPSAGVDEFDWTTPSPEPRQAPPENRFVSALRILGTPPAVLESATKLIGLRSRWPRRRIDPEATTPIVTEQRTAQRRLPGRRPIVVGMALASVTVTALLLVLPTATDGRSAGAASPPDASVSSAAPQADADIAPSQGDLAALMADDPAQALRALALLDDACAAEPDRPGGQSCLQKGDEQIGADSPNGAASPQLIDASSALVTGRWGGSALVSAGLNGRPASFLLVKGEAGWRIREVFEEGQ